MIVGKWVTCTITSGTTTTECDLGREYETVLVQLPSLTSGTVAVQGSKYSGDTAKDIYTYVPTTGAVIQMITAATTGNYLCVFPIGGFRFIKFVCGASQTSKTFYCCGVRS